MDDIARALRRCVSACTVSIKRCLGTLSGMGKSPRQAPACSNARKHPSKPKGRSSKQQGGKFTRLAGNEEDGSLPADGGRNTGEARPPEWTARPVPLTPSQPEPQPKPFTPTQEELIRQLGHELEVLRSEHQAIVDARSPNADMLLRQLWADVVQLGNRVDELPFTPFAGSPEPRLRERRRILVNAVGAMEASIERRLESMSKTQQARA